MVAPASRWGAVSISRLVAPHSLTDSTQMRKWTLLPHRDSRLRDSTSSLALEPKLQKQGREHRGAFTTQTTSRSRKQTTPTKNLDPRRSTRRGSTLECTGASRALQQRYNRCVGRGK
eukprot:778765-Amphidinium_carterae.1